VAPGMIETPMIEGLSAETRTALAEKYTFPKRFGQPSEFAALVMHIIDNRFMNGETIRLDGSVRV
jgi:NAD(P)-dependent dehydrogenase (short-subunit alcohol dehydrogenase family)